jgi:hypothetical protein
MNTMKPLLLAAALLVASPAMASELINVTGDGAIQDAKRCSPTIGAGANYVEKRQRLIGKCERGGAPPAILTENGNRYIEFTTSGASGSGNDRAELAYGTMMRFGQAYTISYRFRIPKGAPVHRAGQMFYPVQIWQCSPLSPIAGMRLVQGTSHDVDFMVRSENSSTPVIARQRLTPGQWHRIELALRPARDASGSLVVRVDGKQIGAYKGAYGADPRKCQSPGGSESWRMKFGIYKSNNPKIRYRVGFDDLKMIRN